AAADVDLVEPAPQPLESGADHPGYDRVVDRGADRHRGVARGPEGDDRRDRGRREQEAPEEIPELVPTPIESRASGLEFLKLDAMGSRRRDPSHPPGEPSSKWFLHRLQSGSEREAYGLRLVESRAGQGGRSMVGRSAGKAGAAEPRGNVPR